MEMVLPKNCTVLSKEEEAVIVGGMNIPITEDMLSKDYCLQRAGEIKSSGQITGMTKQQIAEEIYAHAVVYYYGSEAEQATGMNLSFVLDHTRDGIDLCNGGDSWKRKMAYKAIWKLY